MTGSAITGNFAGRGGEGGSKGGAAGGQGGSGGFGGGVLDTSTVSHTVTNSTIAGNTAGAGGSGNDMGPGGDGGGGGLESAYADPRLLNVTVSGNRAGRAGDTFGGGPPGAAGTGGGIGVFVFGGATLQNTIVAGNDRGGNCIGASVGAITDSGHNLSFPDNSCPGINADPKLGALQDNGGPTQSIALGAGSAAIDRVPASGAGCPATDQLGIRRPQGPACDIGAFEVLQTPIISELSISPSAFTAAASGPSATAASKNHKKHAKTGAKVSYTLNFTATVRFTVQHRVPGRTKGHGSKKRCVARTKHNHKAHKCMLTVNLRGAFTQAGKNGTNIFHFSGRVNGHKLKPGTYTLVATPIANHETGRAVSTTFRILR